MTTYEVNGQAEEASATRQRSFPAGFLWGSSTAAFQIEGATTEDGRTDSIWDTFSRTPGRVLNGDTGDPAVDHYHRMPQDVKLMSDLGFKAYRFSVAWPRVRPDGGAVNEAGLDFYRRLVDELLAHDITPWLTLYHWDLPQTLEDRGGWAERSTAYRFAEYADSVHAALGDRVEHWTTLNEPYCTSLLGYSAGVHAPGRQEPSAAVAAVHHLLLGHGLAVSAIRDRDPKAQLGITLNLYPVDAVNPADPADVDAARRVDGLQNRIFLDPLLRGRYPDDVVADLAPFALAERIHDGDMATIAAPLDMLGVNYYTHFLVGAGTASAETSAPHTPAGSPWVGAGELRFADAGLPVTDMGWEVIPDGLTRVLRRLHEEYAVGTIYVNENGAACPDVINDAGEIDDQDRIEYLDGHLRAALAAIESGVDLRGYFCWSLLDNFEWAWGYSKRFGLVHVDYQTQVRTPKNSAKWLSSVMRENAVPLAGPAEER
ncbi:beta-glucosidase [Actinoalloteichus hoggarensis]|uniref:Beta-glucosidase n=1 Tax=Actinoalloteichus hoggarensis TaxID=1470176 RepID=A0A221W6P9_9PSEU|nr:GH1 family beta-glucosidase [Actinoalloteichus hoggarensis]ASO21343.1 Beta-glucosidase B [Actinoalloteichus hoggarensis]MBB5921276.1 beta-glucosidase [Actinoalloteichus hoggarensis]